MSTTSKITFACSCMFAAGTFLGINYLQQEERAALRQGPIKDAARLAGKEMNKKQIINDRDHKEQEMLRSKFEKVQPLSSEIITAEDGE